MAEAAFRAAIVPSGRGGGHYVEIPPAAVEKLGGGARIPVTATFDGVAYRGSIVRMGGVSALGVLKSILTQTGKGPGDRLEVVVRNDEAPRTVEVPEELASALKRNPKARAQFDSLSHSHRREHAGYVAEAKRPETRERRAQRTIEALTDPSANAP